MILLSSSIRVVLVWWQVVCVGPRRDILDRAVESGADDVVHLEYPPLPTSASPSSAAATPTADVDASILSRLVDQTTMSGYNRMDVAIDLSGDPISFLIAVRSLHRGGTVFELGSHHRPHSSSFSAQDLTPSSAAVPMAELVARSVTLRPITAGSVALLRQLVDVVGIQRIGVEVAAVESFTPDDIRTAIDRYQRRLATGPVVIKYDWTPGTVDELCQLWMILHINGCDIVTSPRHCISSDPFLFLTSWCCTRPRLNSGITMTSSYTRQRRICKYWMIM